MAKAVSGLTIPPLYHLGERSNALRGSRLRLPVQSMLRNLSRYRAADARRAFEEAETEPQWLSPDLIEPMLLEHSKRKTRKDTRSPHEKCVDRVTEVLRAARTLPSQAKILEIACGDCTVAEQMQARGHDVHGIDLAPPKRATTIQFSQMDATNLDYASDQFDLIYAFDSFEHFDHPAGVLKEAHRVLKPGGMLYASFGPLWHSAMGAHQWFSIDLPYCHLLFERDAVNAYAEKIGKPKLTPNLNFWPLKQYRALFGLPQHSFDVVTYFEKFNVAYVDMIQKHPDCFRSTVSDFDELIVRSIEVLLCKRG